MIHPAESDTVMGRQRISVQVMAFVGIAGVSMAVFSLIAVIVASGMYGLNVLSVSAPNNLSDPDTVGALKFVQLFSSLGLFILPPLVFAFLASRKGYHYLCVDQPPALSSSLAVVLIMLFSLPAINWLAAMNAGMQFPDFLSGMEDWMRASEEQAAQLTEAFLKMDTGGDFLFNIFLIAIIPGIGEELLFRGVLQKLLIKWTKNRHAGIWITAILFSALHGQFFGFFPRMLLGAMFGYMLLWSGSLWYPIIGHIINNGSAVSLAYLASRGMVPQEAETFGTAPKDTLYALISMVVVIAAVYGLRAMWYRKKQFT